MPTPSQIEPVEDDEILCRRIPFQWYDPQKSSPITAVAFTPNKNDDDGISLWRKKGKKTCEAVAATGRVGKRYYVALLRAGDLREYGIEDLKLNGLPKNPLFMTVFQKRPLLWIR